MRLLRLFLILTVLVYTTACKNNSTKEINTSTTVEKKNIQHIEVSIEGMTCEIGCAKLIESKIHKLEGVTFSKVNFEHKIGQFSFDSNKISKEEIAKNIKGIAGGELYNVIRSNTVDHFSEFEIIKE